MEKNEERDDVITAGGAALLQRADGAVNFSP